MRFDEMKFSLGAYEGSLSPNSLSDCRDAGKLPDGAKRYSCILCLIYEPDDSAYRDPDRFVFKTAYDTDDQAVEAMKVLLPSMSYDALSEHFLPYSRFSPYSVVKKGAGRYAVHIGKPVLPEAGSAEFNEIIDDMKQDGLDTQLVDGDYIHETVSANLAEIVKEFLERI